MTKNALVSDIILRVTKGKPSDDLELEPRQIAYWIDLVGNSLLSKTLEKAITGDGVIDRSLIYKESCKPLLAEEEPCIDDENERVFIRICKDPIDLENDAGILRMTTNKGQRIDRITLEDVDIVEDLTYGRSATDRLRFYRENRKLFIMGLSMSQEDPVSIIVWYVPRLDIQALKDNEEVNLPDDLLDDIIDAVEQKALRQVYGFEDLQNDGNQGFPVIPPSNE